MEATAGCPLSSAFVKDEQMETDALPFPVARCLLPLPSPKKTHLSSRLSLSLLSMQLEQLMCHKREEGGQAGRLTLSFYLLRSLQLIASIEFI